MKKQLGLIVALCVIAMLLLASLAQAATDCVSHTGENATIIIPKGEVDSRIEPGSQIFALTEEGDCAGQMTVNPNESTYMNVWGKRTPSLESPARGFDDGEIVDLWASVGTIAGEFRHRVYLKNLALDNDIVYGSGVVYEEDTPSLSSLVPAVIDTAVIGWAEQTVVPRDSVWLLRLDLEADVPLGLVLIELKSMPFDGGTISPKVIMTSPSADFYESGDTLAAYYIGAGSRQVTFTISGTGHGALNVYRARATDRLGNLIDVEFATESYAVIHPRLLAGDLNSDGVVDAADVRIMFVAFVTDTVQFLPQNADVWPNIFGDGIVDLTDFYELNKAVHGGQWTNGDPINPAAN
jgi:hypothetical protein